MIPTREEYEAMLIKRQGSILQEKISKGRVAICGLGGLGSNVALCLARAGVGRLHIIDFDEVDLSNIHRQQYYIDQIGMMKTQALLENLKRINPYIEIVVHNEKITMKNIGELLCDDDVICEAFDQPQEKAMLVNEILEKFPDKYLVAASGMAGMESANQIITRKITKQFYLCGDGVNGLEEGMGLVASRVMTCASHEAHMILRILSGEFEE